MRLNTSNPDWVGLANAMRARRGDDTPRLVAADWLDDHDEPELAELIRLMCHYFESPPGRGNALAPHGWDAVHIQHTGLLVRTHALLQRTWLALPACKAGLTLAADELAEWRWVRGFPTDIVCPWEHWFEHWRVLTALGPVGDVVLTTYPYCGASRYTQTGLFHVWVGERGLFELADELGWRWADVCDVNLAEPPQGWPDRTEPTMLRVGVEQVLSRFWRPGGLVGSLRIEPGIVQPQVVNAMPVPG